MGVDINNNSGELVDISRKLILSSEDVMNYYVERGYQNKRVLLKTRYLFLGFLDTF